MIGPADPEQCHASAPVYFDSASIPEFYAQSGHPVRALKRRLLFTLCSEALWRRIIRRRPVTDIALEQPVLETGFLDDRFCDVVERYDPEQLSRFCHRQIPDMI